MHLTLPAMSCDNTDEMVPVWEAHWRPSAQGFTGPGHAGSLCLAHTKSQDFRKGQQVFGPNRNVCTNILGIMGRSY